MAIECINGFKSRISNLCVSSTVFWNLFVLWYAGHFLSDGNVFWALCLGTILLFNMLFVFLVITRKKFCAATDVGWEQLRHGYQFNCHSEKQNRYKSCDEKRR